IKQAVTGGEEETSAGAIVRSRISRGANGPWAGREVARRRASSTPRSTADPSSVTNETRGKCRAFDNPDLAEQRGADAAAEPPGREVFGARVVDAEPVCAVASAVGEDHERPQPPPATAEGALYPLHSQQDASSVDVPPRSRKSMVVVSSAPSSNEVQVALARRVGQLDDSGTDAGSHVAKGYGGAGGAGLKRDDAAETLRAGQQRRSTGS
ncbi:hypothetical protein THAOC_32543, partial [Thalassiosira oceanica]